MPDFWRTYALTRAFIQRHCRCLSPHEPTRRAERLYRARQALKGANLISAHSDAALEHLLQSPTAEVGLCEIHGESIKLRRKDFPISIRANSTLCEWPLHNVRGEGRIRPRARARVRESHRSAKPDCLLDLKRGLEAFTMTATDQYCAANTPLLTG